MVAEGRTDRERRFTLRHRFGTHLLETGQDIRTEQELLDHANVSAAMPHAHVLDCGGLGLASPLHGLQDVTRE